MAEILVPIFRVTDAAETARWYERWGFEVVGEHRFGPDFPLYLFLERNGVQLHLSEHVGDATPGTLVYFWVDDVDEVARIFDAGIVDQPWAREIEVTDPDGNRLRVATRH
ncbi:MAG TPA: glyoxalase superfamily protein [Acidimicrobiales bacterium]|nr:glyoxalase superfamily protein [Acidimicrobiales bacterium]